MVIHESPKMTCRHLSSAPFDKDLVCSCYGAMEDGRGQVCCALWKVAEEEGPLQLLTTLKHEGTNFRWLVILTASLLDSQSYLTLTMKLANARFPAIIISSSR